MAYLTKVQVKQIVQNAPDKNAALNDLVSRGHVMEGYNDAGKSSTYYAKQEADSRSAAAYNPLMPYNSQDVTGSTGVLGDVKRGVVGGGKTAVNLPSSLWSNIKGIGSLVAGGFNPTKDNTLLKLGEMGVGAIAGLEQTALNKLTGKNVKTPQLQKYDAVKEALSERYGGLENLNRTAVNDPVGFALDVMTIAEGGAWSLGKTAELNRAMTSVARPIAAPISKGISKTAGIISPVSKYMTAQMTSMSPETISTLMNKPGAVSEAERAGLNRASLGTKVQGTIEERLANLHETGTGYDQIREAGRAPGAAPVRLQPNFIEKQIASKGLEIVDGKVKPTTLSITRNPRDLEAIQAIYDNWGGKTTMTPEEFLNLRSDLAEVGKYDRLNGKTKASETFAKDTRAALNQQTRGQIPGLENLDKTYAPEKTLLDRIRSEFINPKTGELKDSAVGRILGKNRDVVAERLKTLIPNIEQQTQLIRAMEDIAAAGGQKVGAYAKGALLGFGVSGGNPFAAVLSAFLTSPDIAVPIIEAFGRLKKVSPTLVTNVANKLNTGERLLSNELKFIKDSAIDFVKERRNIPTQGGFINIQKMLDDLKGAVKGKVNDINAALGEGTWAERQGLMTPEAKAARATEVASETKKVSNTEERIAQNLSRKKYIYPSDIQAEAKRIADELDAIEQGKTKIEGFTGEDTGSVRENILNTNTRLIGDKLKTEKIIERIKQIGKEKEAAALKELTIKRSPELVDLEKSFANPAEFSHPTKSPLVDKQYAILTAENPGTFRYSSAENMARNKELFKILKDKGYNPIPTTGKYSDAGTLEHGFLVPGMSDKAALELGKKFEQESVLTKKGLLYQDGTVNPADTSKINFSSAQDNYFTEVDSGGKKVKFSIPIDFDQSKKLEDFVKLPENTELEKVLTDVAPAAKEHIDTLASKIVEGENATVAKVPLKSFESLVRKLKDEKGGNITEITDLARNTIVANDQSSLASIIGKLKATEGAKYKFQSAIDFNGYEGHMFKITAPNGHVAETLVMTPEMFYGKMAPEDAVKTLGREKMDEIYARTKVKPGEGHALYERIRGLDIYDPSDYAQLTKLADESIVYYKALAK